MQCNFHTAGPDLGLCLSLQRSYYRHPSLLPNVCICLVPAPGADLVFRFLAVALLRTVPTPRQCPSALACFTAVLSVTGTDCGALAFSTRGLEKTTTQERIE